MEQYKKAYEELYEAVYGEGKKRFKDKNLANFVAMRGKNYFSDMPGVRFMLVGRATNGWGDGLSMHSAETFANDAYSVFMQQDRYETEWHMKDTDTNPYSPYRDDNGNEKKYYLSTSPFWSSVKNVWLRINKRDNKSDWYENIVWNNIYKVAPDKKCPDDPGNPSEWLINTEGNACVNILKAEVKLLKPTHVLLVIDKNWLGKDCRNAKFNFKNAFESYNDNVFTEMDVDKKFVQDAFISGSTCVVVSCRPEGMVRELYVEAVVEAFNQLDAYIES